MQVFHRKEKRINQEKRQQLRLRQLASVSLKPDTDTVVTIVQNNGNGGNHQRLLQRGGYLVVDGLHQRQSEH